MTASRSQTTCLKSVVSSLAETWWLSVLKTCWLGALFCLVVEGLKDRWAQRHVRAVQALLSSVAA